jgi:putative copper export protein
MTPVLTVLGWLDLFGTAVLAGGVAYAALVAPLSCAGRRVANGGALLVAVTLALELGTTSFRMTAFVPNGGWSLFSKILATHWGVLWIARCVGLATVVSCPLGSRLQMILVALWLLARSLQGHAGAHGPIPAAIDWVHLSAACAWMGGLLQFLVSRPPNRVSVAERLRRIATLSVAALVPAGVYGMWLHVPTLTDLVSTAYGWVLLAKIAVAMALFTIGARNHFVRVPALEGGSTAAFGALRASVRLEVAGGALVLLLSALLGALPMPVPTLH